MTDKQKAAAAQVQAQIDAENKSFEEKKANIKKLIKQAKGKPGFGDNDKSAIDGYNKQLDDLEKAHKEKIKQLNFDLSKAKGRVATSYEEHKNQEAEKAEEEKQKRIEEGKVSNFGELQEMKAGIADKMNNDESIKKAQEQFRNDEISKDELIEVYKKVDPINGENAARQYATTGHLGDKFMEGITDTERLNEIITGKEPENKGPDVLNMTKEQYNDDSIWGDLFGGKAPSALNVAQAAKEAGWDEEKTRAYFENNLGGLSDNAKNALASVYGSKKSTGTGSGASAPAPAGDGKEPEKEVEEEEVKTEPKEEGSFLITTDKDMENLSDTEKLSAVNANIKNLRKEKEAHPEMAKEIDEQIANQVRMKEMVTNNLNLSREDVQGHVNDIGWAEESLNHNRTKGLITSWIDEHNDAKAKLKAAKESGDEKAIAAAQKELDDIPKEYGFFLLNSLGTALKNMSVPGAFGRGQGNEKSMFQTKQESNLAAETNRWNKLKDEKVNAFTEDIKTKWGINSEQYKAANSILNDTNAKRAADRMGIFEDADKIDAVINAKSALSSLGVSERIKVIGMMEDDPVKAIEEMMLVSDVDITELVNNGAQILQDLVNIAGKGSAAVVKFSNWLDKMTGGNK